MASKSRVVLHPVVSAEEAKLEKMFLVVFETTLKNGNIIRGNQTLGLTPFPTNTTVLEMYQRIEAHCKQNVQSDTLSEITKFLVTNIIDLDKLFS
jgi:hypothetical protein